MVRRYKINYDYAIVDALYEYGELGERKLKKTIESKQYLDRIIPYTTFYLRIKKLLHSKYIQYVNGGDWKRGQKILLNLSASAAQQKRLGIFKIKYELEIKPKLLSNNVSFEQLPTGLRTQAVYTIIGMLTIEPYLYRDIIRGALQKAKRVMSENLQLVGKTESDRKVSVGISVKDLVDGSHGFLEFWSVKFSKTAIVKALRVLKKDNVIKEIRYKGEGPKYQINDQELKKFFDDCLKVRDAAIMPRSSIKWNIIKLPYMEERSYYELWNGKRYTDLYVVDAKINLDKQKLKPDYKRIRKDAENHIKMLDYNIYNFFNEIKRNYMGFIERHPGLATGILDIIFPSFLIREGEWVHKETLKNGKRYLPLQISTYRDYLIC